MLVSIVYSSGAGHTARQASAVAEGARGAPGVECRLVNLSTDVVPWEALESSAAIIFGSPTYDGTVSARVKRFFEDSTGPVWLGLRWRNKVAAGFTSSGGRRGDPLDTLFTMALFAARHGMVWVGVDLLPGSESIHDTDRHGAWLGAIAEASDEEGPDVAPVESDLRTAAYLGHRVAVIARRMRP